MERCKTCPHWDVHDYRVYQDNNGALFGLCARLTSYDDVSDVTDRPAEACSYSESIGAEFMTQESFGCTEHPGNKS